MPLPVRAKGVSLSTATNWAFNYIVGEMTPILQDTIEWRLYPMHGAFCVLSFFLGEPLLKLQTDSDSDSYQLFPVLFCK